MHTEKWMKFTLLLLMGCIAACNRPVSDDISVIEQQVPISEPSVNRFKVEDIPLSKASLGVFPFIGIPQGYQSDHPLQSPLEIVPFWSGASIEKIEGEVYSTGIQPLAGQQGSFDAIQQSIESYIISLGGVKLTKSQLSMEQIEKLDKNYLSKFYKVTNGIYQHPVYTYVIRQPEQTVWVQLIQNNSDSAGLLISQSKTLDNIVHIKEDFPFIQLPENYQYREQHTVDHATVPVWMGNTWSLVAGKLFAAGIEAKQKDHGSELEITRYFQKTMQSLGAKKISEMNITSESISPEMKKFMEKYYHATRGIFSAPLHVYILDKDGQKIWFQYAAGTQGSVGLWVLVEKELETLTMSAAKLKEQLDENSKVNIQVNFDSNRAVILDSSKKQLAEVTELLRRDSALKLHIYGHTDNTGQVKQNLALSNSRAQAVVNALIAQGIASERLDAQGFGDQKPIASNATDSGKALNRRVELVKQ